MNPQTIVARSNANHFGHKVNGHGHKPADKVPSVHEQPSEIKPGPFGVPPNEANGEKSTRKASKTAPADATREVQFRLYDHAAVTVLLAGEFTGWTEAPVPLKKDHTGMWQTSVPLATGRYRYKFLVDGEWRDDPTAQQKTANPYGTQDCVVEVG